jgi:uncharacterized protein (TIGR02466 family)
VAGADGPKAASLFETLVVIDRIAEHDSLNHELKRVIAARRAQDQGVQISNVGGWQSNSEMTRWGGEPALRLLERIVATADAFTVDIKADGPPRFRWSPEMWANVSPPGASNSLHLHPGCVWSAVYYVDDGYAGSTDRALGGELVFFDPRMPAIRMNAPDLRFRRPGGTPDHHESMMRPASGMMVMFPAWLSHSVRTYRGAGNRISIAVNLTAVPAGAPSIP